MAYADVVAADANLRNRVAMALIFHAAIQAAAVDDEGGEPRVRVTAREVIDGSMLAPYVAMVLLAMDRLKTLDTASDDEIDAAIEQLAWGYIVKTRL